MRGRNVLARRSSDYLLRGRWPRFASRQPRPGCSRRWSGWRRGPARRRSLYEDGIFTDRRGNQSRGEESLTEELYEQTGRLKMDLEWQKTVRTSRLSGVVC